MLAEHPGNAQFPQKVIIATSLSLNSMWGGECMYSSSKKLGNTCTIDECAIEGSSQYANDTSIGIGIAQINQRIVVSISVSVKKSGIAHTCPPYQVN